MRARDTDCIISSLKGAEGIMAGRKKIIVVDDNAINLTMCKDVLKPYYEVYPAPSAAKMFGLLGYFMPDLILMDVEMPVMNGYEAVRRLKDDQAQKNIPIIFLSGNTDKDDEQEGFALGALDYIEKPFAADSLLGRIKTRLPLGR